MKLKLRLILIMIVFWLCNSCVFWSEPNSLNLIPSEKWTGLNELEGIWTELERDSVGHFLYQPCDGNTPNIIISKDSLVLKHQVEVPTVLKIDEYNISGKNIMVLASSEELKSKFIFKIVEPHSRFILFKWSHIYGKYRSKGKKVITREVLKSKFRFIEDPCDTDKVPNQQFLPVTYE